jgi:hypothetical protein
LWGRLVTCGRLLIGLRVLAKTAVESLRDMQARGGREPV